jgi:hypothetical protein
MSLRDSTDEITEKLSTEIGARVQAAGVRVIESRITHLAYAPEIAQAVLRRQVQDLIHVQRFLGFPHLAQCGAVGSACSANSCLLLETE